MGPSNHLTFTREARPDGTGLRHGLRDHPAFCHVCLNFSYDCALEFHLLRSGMLLDDEAEDPVSLLLNTTYRAVQSDSTMRDVAAAAREGCSSCMVLQACAEAAGRGIFDPASRGLVTVKFTDGAAMTITLQGAEPVPKTIELEVFTVKG